MVDYSTMETDFGELFIMKTYPKVIIVCPWEKEAWGKGEVIGLPTLTRMNFFHAPPPSPVKSISITLPIMEPILVRLASDSHKDGSP